MIRNHVMHESWNFFFPITGGAGSTAAPTGRSGIDLNFPVPDEIGLPCLVKVHVQ